jgi:hypothetical protein
VTTFSKSCIGKNYFLHSLRVWERGMKERSAKSQE